MDADILLVGRFCRHADWIPAMTLSNKPDIDDLKDIIAQQLYDAAMSAYFQASTTDYDDFLATKEDYYEEAAQILEALYHRLAAEAEPTRISDGKRGIEMVIYLSKLKAIMEIKE